VDYFSPANHDCLDKNDLEIGSGGFALLPSDAAGGRSLGMAVTKAGGLYLLDPGNLGKIAPNDSQVHQYIQVGNRQCSLGSHEGHAEGTDWQRLYGNPAYWNGSIYLAPSNSTLRQYRFNGSTLSTTPTSTSATTFFLRGANSVVAANGTSDGIVWAIGKGPNGTAALHAYDANDVSRELWNSEMSGGDHIGAGTAFSVPVVVDGKVIVAGAVELSVYSLK
jgi:hypothetical protein